MFPFYRKLQSTIVPFSASHPPKHSSVSGKMASQPYLHWLCHRYVSRNNITPSAMNTIPSTFTVVTRSLPFSAPSNSVISG